MCVYHLAEVVYLFTSIESHICGIQATSGLSELSIGLFWPKWLWRLVDHAWRGILAGLSFSFRRLPKLVLSFRQKYSLGSQDVNDLSILAAMVRTAGCELSPARRK